MRTWITTAAAAAAIALTPPATTPQEEERLRAPEVEIRELARDLTREQRIALRRAMHDLESARERLRAAEARLLDLIAGLTSPQEPAEPAEPPRGEDPPREPHDPPGGHEEPGEPHEEPVNDPPPRDPPPSHEPPIDEEPGQGGQDPPGEPIDPPDDDEDVQPVPPVVEPPTASWEDTPVPVPPIPAYEIPKLDDCDWIIESGVATSTRGLAAIQAAGAPGELVPLAYRASYAAGHELPVTVGVWDDAGIVVPGGQWNQNGRRSISIKEPDGSWHGVELELVGLDDSCEVTVSWSTRWGRADYLGLFNIGCRGQDDSFVIRANDGIGDLVIDGCWWLPSKNHGPQNSHASGMHIDKWESLVWRNHRWRGETPDAPGILVREHMGYLKSCVGSRADGDGTWIVGNNLLGGNRTGFQIRPQADKNDRPRCPVVIAENYAEGYGFTHPATKKDGGSCITVWTSPDDPVYIFDNRVQAARYGCLTLSPQGPSRNWLNGDGVPIDTVHLWGNTFENRQGDRSCVTITGVGNVHFWGGGTYAGPANGDLTLDDPWGMSVAGISNGSVSIHGHELLAYLQSLNVRTWIPGQHMKAQAVPDSRLATYLTLGN